MYNLLHTYNVHMYMCCIHQGHAVVIYEYTDLALLQFSVLWSLLHVTSYQFVRVPPFTLSVSLKARNNTLNCNCASYLNNIGPIAEWKTVSGCSHHRVLGGGGIFNDRISKRAVMEIAARHN